MFIRTKIKFSKIKESFWKKVCKFSMKKAYSWYDYSYLYQIIGEWLDYSSKQMESYGNHKRSKKSAKEMRVAYELCKRVSSEFCSKNTAESVFGKGGKENNNFMEMIMGGEETKEKLNKKLKKWKELQKRDNDFYLEELTNILKKKSQTWWD